MPSFQFFQNQPEQRSQKSQPAYEVLSLSVVLQYAETAKKQNFEAFCRVRPLVKSYRDKIEETMQAMKRTGSELEQEVEIPAGYAAALGHVNESFAAHLGALDEWMNAIAQKNEPSSERAMATARQSGQQLESALQQLAAR